MNKIRDAATFLKTKFQTDQLDDKLTEAVSEQNWQASTQLLHEIANASYNYEKEQKIINFIWQKVKIKSWKKVLKTLHLVDFLLKYGPTSLIQNMKENVYQFRQLDDFTFTSEGIDRGQSIRKQAKVIVSLLSDEHLLNDQRAKAKQIKERMASVIGSGAYYGNFSSNSLDNGPTFDTKKPTYGSFSSQTYRPSGPSNSGGLSFGQSIMKELHEKKKYQHPPVSQKINPSKLNLSSMNERKQQSANEQKKTSFNNLSLKLVKPPEKKPAQKKPQNKLQQPQVTQKAQPKQAKKIDIMDLDLMAMGDSMNQPPSSQISGLELLGTTPQSETKQNLLGFEQPSLANFQPVSKFALPTTQVTQNSNPPKFSNNFLGNDKGITQPPLFQQKPQNTAYNPQINLPSYPLNTNISQGFTLGGYQNPTNTLNFNLQPLPQQNKTPVTLTLNTQPKVENKNNLQSIIDFSNFREELGSLNNNSNKKEENITTGWNW